MLHDFHSAIDGGRFPALSPRHGGGSHTTVNDWHRISASANCASQPLYASATCDSSVNARDPLGIGAIIRAQTARDFSAALAEWQRASGADRAYWRRYVRLYIREERARLARSRAALHAAATQARARRDDA